MNSGASPQERQSTSGSAENSSIFYKTSTDICSGKDSHLLGESSIALFLSTARIPDSVVVAVVGIFVRAPQSLNVWTLLSRI